MQQLETQVKDLIRNYLQLKDNLRPEKWFDGGLDGDHVWRTYTDPQGNMDYSVLNGGKPTLEIHLSDYVLSSETGSLQVWVYHPGKDGFVNSDAPRSLYQLSNDGNITTLKTGEGEVEVKGADAAHIVDIVQESLKYISNSVENSTSTSVPGEPPIAERNYDTTIGIGALLLATAVLYVFVKRYVSKKK